MKLNGEDVVGRDMEFLYGDSAPVECRDRRVLASRKIRMTIVLTVTLVTCIGFVYSLTSRGVTASDPTVIDPKVVAAVEQAKQEQANEEFAAVGEEQQPVTDLDISRVSKVFTAIDSIPEDQAVVKGLTSGFLTSKQIADGRYYLGVGVKGELQVYEVNKLVWDSCKEGTALGMDSATEKMYILE